MKKLNYLLCFTMLIACEKENEFNTRTYQFDSFETGNLRVFTKEEEIIDSQLSANFINKWNNYFYEEEEEFTLNNFDLKGEIIFSENNQVFVQNSDTTMIYKLQIRENFMYFESLDTAYINYNLKNEKLRLSPITQTSISTVTVPGSNIFLEKIYRYGYLPCVYAIENGNKIKFPILNFLEKNCDTNRPNSIFKENCNVNAFSNVNNLIDEDYIERRINRSNLSDSYKDTIVLQENYIVFSRQ